MLHGEGHCSPRRTNPVRRTFFFQNPFAHKRELFQIKVSERETVHSAKRTIFFALRSVSVSDEK
jgi:hypothetical protein